MKTPEYLITCPEAETLIPSGLKLEQGTFVTERADAGGFLNQSLNLAVRPFGRVFRPAPVAAGDIVLIVRPGGFGDLLFCTPTIRFLREMGCEVWVSCLERFAPVLEANPDIKCIVPYPVPVSTWDCADRHIWLERILEDGVSDPAETFTRPAVELIAEAAGVRLDNFALRYDVTPSESEWAARTYPRNDKPRVGIQIEASAKNRTYPFQHVQVVAGLLAREGYEIMLFGRPGLIGKTDGPFINLTADNLSFRESCAVLATCDAVVAPDSALCHVAGALGIPTVATFGPFLAQSRVSCSPSVHAVDGKAPCAPCNHHDNRGETWPQGCPGRQTGRCAALENIPPALVAAKVEHLIALRQA